MIITIARQCGCGAVHVGKLLAEHYGIPFYTRKTLMDMAREHGVLDEMESFFDERPVDDILERIRLGGVGSALDGDGSLVVGVGRRTPAAVLLLHIHTDPAVRPDAVVAACLT